MNGHWGKWYLNRSLNRRFKHNQHFRFDPVSNTTHMETATEELQFHWKDLDPASVTSRDCDAGSDERDFEELRAALSELESKHSNIAPNHELKGQLHGVSSTITLEKSKLDSFAAYVASTPNHTVATSSSVTETATTVATWIFGTIMAGVGVGTMRATQKTAEAGTRSAVAGESSALSSRKSAAAAEESARAATKSAQAAENGVAVMQKQLEVMIQDKRGPPPATNSSIGPPADNSGSGTGSVKATRSDAEISGEQQTARSVSTATPPAPGAMLASAPVDAPQEGVSTGGSPEQMDPVQTLEATQNAVTSERRAVPINTTPSAMMTTANISLPQAPTSNPGELSVKQNPPKQVSSVRTNGITLPKETICRKEGCLRNITVAQDELQLRKQERERMVVLERRLQELRNRFA